MDSPVVNEMGKLVLVKPLFYGYGAVVNCVSTTTPSDEPPAAPSGGDDDDNETAYIAVIAVLAVVSVMSLGLVLYKTCRGSAGASTQAAYYEVTGIGRFM
jgi:hypothetical protein